jgi:uncharacterized membrane protein YbhN (UPF0104 family)
MTSDGRGPRSATTSRAPFLFRLATFWLPTIPGWLAFHGLTKRELL